MVHHAVRGTYLTTVSTQMLAVRLLVLAMAVLSTVARPVPPPLKTQQMDELREEMAAMRREMRAARADARALEREVQRLRAENDAAATAAGRQMQCLGTAVAASTGVGTFYSPDASCLAPGTMALDTGRYPEPSVRSRKQQSTCPPSVMTAHSTAAMNSCCPSGGGHRRTQVGAGGGGSTCTLPLVCPSMACASSFAQFFEACSDSMRTQMAPGHYAQYRQLYTGCQELQAGQATLFRGASPVRMFSVVVVPSEADAQMATMFPHASPPPLITPIGGLPPPPPAPSLPTPPPPTPPSSGNAGGAATAALEFQRVCTQGNLTICAPPCVAATRGYLLSIEIDGMGTVMTCIKVHNLYSWQGQASLGGYLGSDFAAFFASVNSHAAGTFMITGISTDQSITTELTVAGSQTVVASGDPRVAEPPGWSSPLTVQDSGSLSVTHLTLRGAVTLRPHATSLTIRRCKFDAGVLSSLADAYTPGSLQAGMPTRQGVAPAFAPDNSAVGAGTTLTLLVRAVASRVISHRVCSLD